MNGAEFHLLFNHLPVILSLVAGSLIAIGIFAGSKPVQNVGLGLMVTAALTAIPTYLSGEKAENIVKNFPGITRGAIHEHEDAAWTSLLFLEVTGALSLALILAPRFKRKIPRPVWATLLLLSLVSFVLMARTAHLGGLIRHEEIRPGTVS